MVDMTYWEIKYNFLVDSVSNCYFDSILRIYHLRQQYYPKQFYKPKLKILVNNLVSQCPTNPNNNKIYQKLSVS